MTAARFYSSIAAQATLTAPLDAVSTIIAVSTTSGWPSYPFALTIDKDRVSEEIVLATSSAGGLNVNVTRGYDGTSATTHSSGATVTHTAIGADFTDAAGHVGTTTNHWNSTNTDTLELPWQWSRPGFVTTGLTTGSPLALSSAGPTTLVASPASGRRVLKQVLITGGKGVTCTVTAAGTQIAKFTFPNGASDPTKQTAQLSLAFPFTSAETVTATTAGGSATFTPVYADRTDTSFTRLGLANSSGSGTLVASGTVRKVTQLWIANTGAVTATGSVAVGGTTVIDSVSLATGGVFSLDDPFTITNSQAITYAGDTVTAMTYFAVGI